MTISEDNRRFLRALTVLAPPIIIQEMLNTSINLLDTVMIGRALGSSEIAAVGIANQVFFLFILILFGANSGSAIFVGQYWGAEDKPNIWKTMGIAFSFNAFVSLLFLTLTFFAPGAVMRIYSRDPEVIQFGIDYLRVIGFSYIITSITVTRNSALRATGNTKLPMMTAFISLITNFAFNYLMIYTLKMGVRGAAYATLIARVVELLTQEILIRILKMPIRARLKDYFSFKLDFVKEFFKVTVFVILNESIWATGISVYNIAYSFCGTESQAAYQVGLTIMQIFQVFGMAIGTACAIMLSNYLGSGDEQRAIRYSRKCLKMTAVISIVMAGLLLLGSPFIIDFYNLEESVNAIASRLMFVVAVGMIPKNINYTSICGILRSGGDTKFCFMIDTLSVWVLGVPMSFLGAVVLELPIYIVVLMTYSEEAIKFGFAFKRVLSNVWAKKLV